MPQMQLKMYNINKDRVVKGEIEIGRSKGAASWGWRATIKSGGSGWKYMVGELGVEGDVLIACG